MTDIEAGDTTEAAAPAAKSEPFRFFDNREKYLLFVMTTSEKAEVAARIGYSEETVRHSIAALGMSESVRRLFRLRRRTARREAAANADLPVKAMPIRPIGTRRTPTIRVA